MDHPSTFLPPEVLERSRGRRRRTKKRLGTLLAKAFRASQFERRDALVVLLVLVGLATLVSFTHVFDRWFDRFNRAPPDQIQAVEALAR